MKNLQRTPERFLNVKAILLIAASISIALIILFTNGCAKSETPITESQQQLDTVSTITNSSIETPASVAGSTIPTSAEPKEVKPVVAPAPEGIAPGKPTAVSRATTRSGEGVAPRGAPELSAGGRDSVFLLAALGQVNCTAFATFNKPIYPFNSVIAEYQNIKYRADTISDTKKVPVKATWRMFPCAAKGSQVKITTAVSLDFTVNK
jgi:hypothetical protein